MKQKFTFLSTVMGILAAVMSYSQDTINIQHDPQQDTLRKLADSFHRKFLTQHAAVEKLCREKGWKPRRENPGGVSEIQYIDDLGFPQAFSAHNLNARKTTNTDDIWQGGSTGLNLTGNGYILGEWDGGGFLTTHQEFNTGSGTRVTQMDTPESTSAHSTRVAGTMVARGQVAAAHGMATGAILHAYDWNDAHAEMATAAAGGLTLSNHSYDLNRGWVSNGGIYYWWGNTSVSAKEDYLFGFYDATSQEEGQLAFSAPNYLIVRSAGNSRGVNNPTADSMVYYSWNGTDWNNSIGAKEPNGGSDGFDCLGQMSLEKNVLTVGAVDDIPGGWTSPSDVVMYSFGIWGPTDDGRIKPDLVGNGVDLYSCTDSSNTSYSTSSGTSYSAPNVTVILVLLQDYYKTLRGGTMSAAALKGLAINTANEAGPAPVPDYMFGWGLMNASGAANLITTDNSQGGQIVQSTLVTGQTTSYTYYSAGTSGTNVSLCWTDPPGTPPAPALNPSTLMLVNDLDIRIIRTTTSFPRLPSL